MEGARIAGWEQASHAGQLPTKSALADLANEVDRHIGERIREHRLERGLTQQDLARALGISYQQVQKYENGSNRVSAGRLYILAQALGVRVGAFFEGFGAPPAARRLSLTNEETIQAAKELAAIRDPRVKSTLRALLRALGNPGASAF
ncbi:MAG: helix-turn-helix domain-containing protein [Rhodothalassiaceae bacterium]